MIVYYRRMRVKDDIKREAIISATVELVNEIGFASSSVSKIAKRAGVSPATIYIYFENKEDLIKSAYIEIKSCLGKAILEGFDAELPFVDAMRSIGKNLFRYIKSNREIFYFTEQFANSPYHDDEVKRKIDHLFEPVMSLLNQGIEMKIIKDVPHELLLAHLFFPIFSLVNPRLNPGFEANEKNVNLALDMAWDAVRR